MAKWHVVMLVSNKVRIRRNLSWRLILGRRIHLWYLFLKLTKSSLIIHRKVTCHFGVKQSQKKTKFVMMPNFRIKNSYMTFIFEIDKSLLIIHRKVTCYHFGVKQCQKKTKFVMILNFGIKNSYVTFIFEIDKVFINYS